MQATLDEGLRAWVQWNRTILIAESHKLDPEPLDEGPTPKSGKLRLNPHGTILDGKSIVSDPKKKEHQGELMIWRTKMQARVQGTVQLKDSVCFKWVQIGS
jgi:hypothetical protein